MHRLAAATAAVLLLATAAGAQPLPPPRPPEFQPPAPPAAEADTPSPPLPPSPPPRPAELTTPVPGSPEPSDSKAAALPEDEKACRATLGGLGVVFEPLPAIVGPGECGAPHPLRLRRLSPATAVTGDPTVTCEVAEALARWARDGLAPAAAAIGSAVSTLQIGTSYQCRGRNNDPAARLSEHAFANGVDLAGFTLANGRTIAIGSATEPGFQAEARRSACAAFTTVLGPGAEGHADHLHLDMRGRKGGYRICE
jgi:hypothetical protein